MTTVRPLGIGIVALILGFFSLVSNAAGLDAPAAFEIEQCVPALFAVPSVVSTPLVGATPVATGDDLTIIDAMIGQHARSIQLANLALGYAQNSQVRRMALRIAESQAGELQLLRSWRTLWYPSSGPPPSPVAVNTESTESNCAAPGFDHRFLTAIIEQLRSEVALATYAQTAAGHNDLQNFASSLVNVRGDEIEMLDRILTGFEPATPAMLEAPGNGN